LRRLEPPALNRGQILRPRLLERLNGRWGRRATVIVGGPGFGKSTLLAQAIRENLLAPHGSDHWLSLTFADNEPEVLLAGIVAALSLPIPTIDMYADDVIERVAAAARSLPPGTCLVVDDVHELRVDRKGIQTLASMINLLPLQCSVVLSSRVEPSIPMADWRAKGLVEVIVEDDLRYTEAELAEMLGARPQLGIEGAHGGWPALVELLSITGTHGTEAYLREVVLSRLSVDDRRRIAALDAINGGDLDLLEAALDEPLDADVRTRIQQFPMTQPFGVDGIRPHALWHPVLVDMLTPQERLAVRGRAAEELLRRGGRSEALALFAESSDWDGVARVIREACGSGNTELSFATLDNWRRSFPPSEEWRPEWKLVAGMAERASNTWNEATSLLLSDAVDAFRTMGDVGAEVSAMAELAFVSRERGDEARLLGILIRLSELETAGASEVFGMLSLGRAVMFDAMDDDKAVLAQLGAVGPSDLPGHWFVRALWMQGQANLLLGRPAEALTLTERARDGATDYVGARTFIHYIKWWLELDAATIDSFFMVDDEVNGSPFDRLHGGALSATVHAYFGEIGRARHNLAIAESLRSALPGTSSLRPEYLLMFAFAAAAIAVAEGDETLARDTLRSIFELQPIAGPVGRRAARRCCGLVIVLLPEHRAAVHDETYGPAIAEARALAEWFVDLRNGLRVRPPSTSTQSRLLNALPLRWAIEAVARFAAFDLPAAKILCEELVRLRGALVRSLLSSFVEDKSSAKSRPGQTADPVFDSAVVSGSKRLLAEVPVAPEAPLTIGLLGPLEVIRGNDRHEPPELRRERVRQIVAILAVQGPTSRGALCDTLWPDLDLSAASQNLRTTLSYVHRVLEPDRSSGQAPFVLRQRGEILSLVGAPWLETDVSQFDSSIRKASTFAKNGAYSAELEHLERALLLVRGEPLIDADAGDLVSGSISTLRVQIAVAAQRAAELRFAISEHERAQSHATLCLRFDPWNESASNLLVASPLAEGRIGAARQALDSWKRRDAELGVGPSPAIEMLSRRLLSESSSNAA
jgi:LuxR family transcriptional regulator, maltose regulon positive regulatory protein